MREDTRDRWRRWGGAAADDAADAGRRRGERPAPQRRAVRGRGGGRRDLRPASTSSQGSTDELASLLAGHDAVVFSAGAHGTGRDQTTAIDGKGLEKAVDAARQAGVARFVLVSVFPDAGRDLETNEGFEHYMRVKKAADVYLTATDLDWVVVRPGHPDRRPRHRERPRRLGRPVRRRPPRRRRRLHRRRAARAAAASGRRGADRGQHPGRRSRRRAGRLSLTPSSPRRRPRRAGCRRCAAPGRGRRR